MSDVFQIVCRIQYGFLLFIVVFSCGGVFSVLHYPFVFSVFLMVNYAYRSDFVVLVSFAEVYELDTLCRSTHYSEACHCDSDCQG